MSRVIPSIPLQLFGVCSGSASEYCAHINAVLNRLVGRTVRRQMTATLREERLAIQNEGRTAPDRDQQRGPAVMLLKRSVSPDGRIDSLSVEFTAEVDGMVVKEVADRAARLLMLSLPSSRVSLTARRTQRSTAETGTAE